MTERGLVDAAMRGNAQAFNTLVSQYQRVMVASACRIVRNADDAEDLAQEALVDAYRDLPTLRDRGKFRPWLFSILRHKCLNYLQARRPEELTFDELANLPAPVPAELPDVAELLDQLPLPYREVLVMRYLQELDFREIAGIVGANEGAVRRRCSRARAQLQALAVERNEGRMRKIMAGLLALPISDAFTARVAKEVATMAQVALKGKLAASGTTAGVSWVLGWKGAMIAGLLLLAGAGIVVSQRAHHPHPTLPIVQAAPDTTSGSSQVSPILPISTARIVPPKNAPQILAALRRYDDMLRQGSVTYDEACLYPPIEINTYRNQLYYAADGRVHNIPTLLSGTRRKLEIVCDKDYGFIVIPDAKLGTQITFDHMAKATVDGKQFPTQIVAGPSFPLGRGLTLLKDIRLDAKGPRLLGSLPDGTRVEALLDPSHGYVAREITCKERLNNGRSERVVSRWTLSDSRDFGDGVCIATRSTCAFALTSSERPDTYRLRTINQITVRQAQFTTPSEALLTYDWHRPGLRICDCRIAGGASDPYKTENLPPNITPAQLLVKTRAWVAEQNHLRDNNTRYEEAQKQKIVGFFKSPLCKGLYWLVAVIVMTAIAISLFRKQQGKKITPYPRGY